MNVQWFRDGLVFEADITQLKARGPSRTCNESKEEEKKFPVLRCVDVWKSGTHEQLKYIYGEPNAIIRES